MTMRHLHSLACYSAPRVVMQGHRSRKAAQMLSRSLINITRSAKTQRVTRSGLQRQVGRTLWQAIHVLCARELEVHGHCLWALGLAIRVRLEGLLPPALGIALLLMCRYGRVDLIMSEHLEDRQKHMVQVQRRYKTCISTDCNRTSIARAPQAA